MQTRLAADGPRHERLAGRLALVAAGAAVASLAVTAAVVVAVREPGVSDEASGWFVVEAVALLVGTILVVRWAPVRTATVTALLCGAAVSVSLLRYGDPGDSTAGLAGVAAWTSVVGLAACVGLYLRALDTGRARSVAAARQAQRLVLARDLHDFVAHDVSGILAQAQAGLLVAAQDPVATAAVLERIEASALHALTSMDRTIGLLQCTGEGPAAPTGARALVPTLTDLSQLVQRFDPPVDLAVDPGLPAIPDDAGSTGYRVVMEALTNVRRHAHSATRVQVAVCHVEGALELTISDDGRHGGSTHSRRSGLGLAGLTERVEALGGTLRAGPLRPHGWQVRAVVPLLLDGRCS